MVSWPRRRAEGVRADQEQRAARELQLRAQDLEAALFAEVREHFSRVKLGDLVKIHSENAKKIPSYNETYAQ